jgi:hypothetical protein
VGYLTKSPPIAASMPTATLAAMQEIIQRHFETTSVPADLLSNAPQRLYKYSKRLAII